MRWGDRLCRGLATLAAQVAFDRGEGTPEPLGQHLQALVRVGVPEAHHLAVVYLVMPTGDPGQRVEVLRLYGDAQPVTNLRPLRRGRACDVAGDIVFNDRATRVFLGRIQPGSAEMTASPLEVHSPAALAPAFGRRGWHGARR